LSPLSSPLDSAPCVRPSSPAPSILPPLGGFEACGCTGLALRKRERRLGFLRPLSVAAAVACSAARGVPSCLAAFAVVAAAAVAPLPGKAGTGRLDDAAAGVRLGRCSPPPPAFSTASAVVGPNPRRRARLTRLLLSAAAARCAGGSTGAMRDIMSMPRRGGGGGGGGSWANSCRPGGTARGAYSERGVVHLVRCQGHLPPTAPSATA
jgi:hypothetical protein